MRDVPARTQFTEFKERTEPIADTELDAWWSKLEPARIEEMIGEWAGGEFTTGHKMNGQLEKAGWFGKTFNSATDVQPLVCRDADGKKFSNIAMGKGEASLWLEDFRGEVTATMVYDGQPVHDHFKKIHRNAVMGIMNGKHALDFSSGTGRHLYFYLERVTD
jgi:hypothetical protein